MMPLIVAILLTQLGCAGWAVTLHSGERVMVWVCPPVATPSPPPEAPDERES